MFESREFGFYNENICPIDQRAMRLNSGHVYLIRPEEVPKKWFKGIEEKWPMAIVQYGKHFEQTFRWPFYKANNRQKQHKMDLYIR
jgi:hypothetical protein